MKIQKGKEITTMTKIERLNKLTTTRDNLIAELIEIEKLLNAKTQTMTLYEGGSRYSLAGPGDDRIIGTREIVVYEKPQYIAIRNRLINEIENVKDKIDKLENRG